MRHRRFLSAAAVLVVALSAAVTGRAQSVIANLAGWNRLAGDLSHSFAAQTVGVSLPTRIRSLADSSDTIRARCLKMSQAPRSRATRQRA
jgi:hypothetical protein